MQNLNNQEQKNENFTENTQRTTNPDLGHIKPRFSPKITVQNSPIINQQNRLQHNQQQNYQQQNSSLNNSYQNHDITEYQPQNQLGFQQWQQMQRQENAQSLHQFIPQQIMVPSLWRQSDELVVHKFAKIPNRCVKCNEYVSDFSGNSYIPQKYRWHHPLVYIALISPLIFLILSMALSKRVTLSIPLCSEHIEEKKNIGGYLAGIGVFSTISVVLFASLGYIGFAILLALMAIIGLAVGNEHFYKPLRVSKIEDDYVYLKGVDIDFLNQVPNR